MINGMIALVNQAKPKKPEINENSTGETYLHNGLDLSISNHCVMEDVKYYAVIHQFRKGKTLTEAIEIVKANIECCGKIGAIHDFKGKRMSVSEVSEDTDINRQRLTSEMKRKSCTIEEAVKLIQVRDAKKAKKQAVLFMRKREPGKRTLTQSVYFGMKKRVIR